MPDSLAKWFASEWQAIAHAPSLFLAAIAASAFVIWKAMEWRYGGQVERQQHELESVRRRLDEHENGIDWTKRPSPAKPAFIEHEGDAYEQAAQPARTPWLNKHNLYQLPEDRVIIEGQSPKQLMEMLDGMTSAQEDVLAKPYLSKWLKVELPVRNVISRDDETVVLCVHQDHAARFVWLHFSEDRDRLEILKIGQNLSAVGRLTELNSVGMRLYSCEVVK